MRRQGIAVRNCGEADFNGTYWLDMGAQQQSHMSCALKQANGKGSLEYCSATRIWYITADYGDRQFYYAAAESLFTAEAQSAESAPLHLQAGEGTLHLQAGGGAMCATLHLHHRSSVSSLMCEDQAEKWPPLSGWKVDLSWRGPGQPETQGPAPSLSYTERPVQKAPQAMLASEQIPAFAPMVPDRQHTEGWAEKLGKGLQAAAIRSGAEAGKAVSRKQEGGEESKVALVERFVLECLAEPQAVSTWEWEEQEMSLWHVYTDDMPDALEEMHRAGIDSADLQIGRVIYRFSLSSSNGEWTQCRLSNPAGKVRRVRRQTVHLPAVPRLDDATEALLDSAAPLLRKMVEQRHYVE